MKIPHRPPLLIAIAAMANTGEVVRAWTSQSQPVITNNVPAMSPPIISASTVTTRSTFLVSLVMGTACILANPNHAVAEPPPKKIPTYLKERGSLEAGVSSCPGQPAKKCCWSTEDTQGRKVQRWEPPDNIQGKSTAIAREIEQVMNGYPQEGQNDVDKGGWIQADRQTDDKGATFLRYEFTSGKFKYIDEMELLVDASGKVSARTSSRSAGFDYDVNTTRLNYIQRQLQKRGWKVKMVG